MGPFIFLDIESTGFDPFRDHIIEVAAIKWQDGKRLNRFERLIRPPVPIPQEIVLLTGISDNDISSAPVFSEAKNELADFIGELPIAGHNIAFDMGFLKSHHLDLKNPEIDTVSLARILLRKEASYALEVLMKKYKLPLRDSHRAMADTETAVDFFEFLLKRIREIPLDLTNKIREILQKSSWAGREVFV